ncbi:DsbA family protein [Roseomonas marmotae]|uniref:DsbA family protein n=1 Tax=Roseomonas marmotae TaxID=2768161 RepID=A0ABS3KFR0_9PROT|nr:DsbA family protein [Roseomonas marmotae]MBO1076314.1 DsbA family protein [Roseomonas marmotae]QTI80554.1 DsbA family protein [Roseomonas marmotae]
MPKPRLATALMGLSLIAATPALASEALTPAQRQEVVEVLRQALKQDPSILRDALAAMQEAQQQDRAEAQRAAIAAHAGALLRNPEDPVKGNPKGDVTLVEFFDARCGYCKILHPTLEQLVKSDPDLRVVMKDLPILGPASVLASRALLAAQRQGKYLPLQEALMRLRSEPTEAALKTEAERAGLDWARLRRDMDDPAIQRRLEGNMALAQALSIEGTPALVIGDRLVPGAVDLATLQALVAEARQQARGSGG